jgi:hypothetical protein
MELEVYYKPITAKIHFQLQTKRSMDLQAGANCQNTAKKAIQTAACAGGKDYKNV